MPDQKVRVPSGDYYGFIDETTFFRLILDHISECFVAVDTSGRIVHINKPYCSLLEKTAEECLGEHITDVISANTKLHLVAQGAPPVIGGPLTVKGQQLFTRQVPVRLNGELIGAVGMALFSDIKQALSFAKSLRGHSVSLDKPATEWRVRYSIEDIYGTCEPIEALRQQIHSAAQTDFNLIIQGETGTGKELAANSVHALSSRATKPFVAVNCGAIPEDLIESELFGYEGGAFTGAISRGKSGKLELAHEGTLFLDEIGDLPLSSQTALLRVIECGELQRLGAQIPRTIDVRIICATHRDLHKLALNGHFRSDLLYRLDVLELSVPPLRIRSDIPDLAHHVLRDIVAKMPSNSYRSDLKIAPDVLAQLESYSWPGNVRELRNVLERAIASLSEGAREINTLPTTLRKSNGNHREDERDLASIVQEAEYDAIVEALERCNGNRSAAAKHLGVDRTTLYKKLKALNIC